jgi:hypothetical protein
VFRAKPGFLPFEFFELPVGRRASQGPLCGGIGDSFEILKIEWPDEQLNVFNTAIPPSVDGNAGQWDGKQQQYSEGDPKL